MRTSAKNTLYSDALIFILELLSQVKSDCREKCSGDGDNHRTCHITVYCFSLKCGIPAGIHKSFSFAV